MGYDPQKIKGTNHRDIESLHPKVQPLALEFIAKANQYLNPKGFSVKIISTLRNNEEQQALYNQGRTTSGRKVTNARPGYSTHNFGVGFDVGIFKDKLYNPPEADKYYSEIAPIAKRLGLEWGGDWISIKDRPHYQFTGKYSNNDFLRLARDGRSIDDLLS